MAASSARSIAPGVGLLALIGGGVLGIRECTFNVEGGHRAIVFNRFTGIKDQVGLVG